MGRGLRPGGGWEGRGLGGGGGWKGRGLEGEGAGRGGGWEGEGDAGRFDAFVPSHRCSKAERSLAPVALIDLEARPRI